MPHRLAPALTICSPDQLPAPDREARRRVWSRHWATGAAHSCSGSFGDKYGGAIAEFWDRALSACKAGDRLLDIATGSGALPRLILSRWPDLLVQIDAIDLARIEPTWLALFPEKHRQRVRLIGDLGAEHLPFANDRFDLIISQYGLEYSNLELSVAEILRVLAPQGRLALIMHHANSQPAQLAAVEIGHIDWLLSPTGLLSAARDLLEPMTRAATAAGRHSLTRDPRAEAARETFNAAQDCVRVRMTTSYGADVLFDAQQTIPDLFELAATQGIAAAEQRWKKVQTEFEDARLRLQDLGVHALSADDIESLRRRLQESQLSVEIAEIKEQGYLMGWTLTAKFSP